MKVFVRWKSGPVSLDPNDPPHIRSMTSGRNSLRNANHLNIMVTEALLNLLSPIVDS